MKDPYQILGVSKNATDEEIKKAYRRLAKANHPDLHPGDKSKEEKFKEIGAAYELIRNKEARDTYEKSKNQEKAWESAWQNARSQSGPFYYETQGFNEEEGGGRYSYSFGGMDDDLFDSLFGRARRPAGGAGFPGQDHHYKMEVSLRDAVTGAEKEIDLPTGKRLKVKIPAGISDGTKLRFKGQGGPGRGRGAVPGDAYVEITIRPSETFRKVDNNLELDLPVSLNEAVNGAKIEVPTVEGAVMLTIKPGVTTGTRLRIPGKGYPLKGGGRGDQIVIIKIVLPEKIDHDLKALIDQWSAKHPYNPRATGFKRDYI